MKIKMNKDVLNELTRLCKAKLKKLNDEYVSQREAEIIKIIAMHLSKGMLWWKVPYTLTREEALAILCSVNSSFRLPYYYYEELDNDNTKFLDNIIQMKYSSHITEIEFTLNEYKFIYS